MLELETDLYLAHSVFLSNVWLLTDKRNRRFLIDTGEIVERNQLKWSLARAGIRRPGDLTAILLTHWHRDHAGNAAWARDFFHCPVICHENDAPYLTGSAQAPAMPRLSRSPIILAACGFQEHQPALSPVDDTYEIGRWRWGFDVISTPGHTEGSVMLYHRPSKTLFSGDTILNGMPPLRVGNQLRFAMEEYSQNNDISIESAKSFLRNMPPVLRLCCGHGHYVNDSAMLKLRKMLEDPEEKPSLREAITKSLGELPYKLNNALPFTQKFGELPDMLSNAFPLAKKLGQLPEILGNSLLFSKNLSDLPDVLNRTLPLSY